MRIPAFLVACVVVFAACGGDNTSDDADPRDGKSDAPVGEFVSSDVDGHDLVAGTEIFLALDGSELSARAGCNAMGGPYHVEGFDDGSGVLVVDADGLFMTEMGCDPARDAQDNWLADLLLAQPIIAVLDAERITLSDGTATIRFVDREVADPDRPLVGTEWKVDTILQGDVASSVPSGGVVTFVFGDDGRVVVTSEGCTAADVPFEQLDADLTFGAYAVDDIGCPSPWSETRALLDAGTVEFAIDHARLTLTAPGGTGLSLAPAE